MATQQLEPTVAFDPALLRTPTERGSFVQFYGPVQNEGINLATSATWTIHGAATSTSFKKFWFNRAWKNISWAALRVEWIPTVRANCIRLIAADDGIVNIQQLAEIVGTDNRNPVASAADVTTALRTLARAGVPKQIGWQVRGDGRTALRVYQVYLEILEA